MMAEIGEDLVMVEVSEIIMRELRETMNYCDECETQVNDFIKIANCILNQDEYYDLLYKFKKFESSFSILDSLSAQIDYPLSILQVVTLKATMKELKSNFDQLIMVMQVANKRIDDNQIDFAMARLIQWLLKIVEFDAIAYEGLEEAMKNTIIVLELLTIFDLDYPKDYYPLNVLKLVSCKDKISAYEYALEKGISRDMIINRHGAHFT